MSTGRDGEVSRTWRVKMTRVQRRSPAAPPRRALAAGAPAALLGLLLVLVCDDAPGEPRIPDAALPAIPDSGPAADTAPTPDAGQLPPDPAALLRLGDGSSRPAWSTFLPELRTLVRDRP